MPYCNMNAIETWFKSKMNYAEGLEIYQSLSCCDARTLKVLQKGKSQRNLGLMVRELRIAKKNLSVPEVSPVLLKKTVPVKKTPQPKPIPVINKQEQLAKHTHNKDASFKTEFGAVTYASLPKELRPRFSEARNLFYQMCDLKFELNDVPDAEETTALELIIKIHEVSREKDLIWQELNHWHVHKTILPGKPSDDFTDLDLKSLHKKHKNTEISISKINKRVDKLYNKLVDEKDKHQQHLLERRITKSETTLHQHKLNLMKLKKLI